MDRRTFLNDLAGLPFMGGVVKDNEPAILRNVPPSSMKGFVRDFDSAIDLLEYVVHSVKGETHNPVRIHGGNDVYDIFSECVTKGSLKDWQDGIGISTERVPITGKNWEFYIYRYGGHGIVYYKIWPIRNFYRLEYIKIDCKCPRDKWSADHSNLCETIVWDSFIEN